MSNKNNRNNKNNNTDIEEIKVEETEVVETSENKEDINKVEVSSVYGEVKDRSKDNEVEEDNKTKDVNNENDKILKEISEIEKEIEILKKKTERCYDPVKLGLYDSQIRMKFKDIENLKIKLSTISGKTIKQSRDIRVKDRRNIQLKNKVETLTITSK